MDWIKQNSKQLLVLALSIVCGVALHYRPEWRDVIIGIGGALAAVGIHLPPIAYGEQQGPKVPSLPPEATKKGTNAPLS